MARKADTPDPVARVRTLLEQLNLTTAARRLAELLAQAETAQPSYSAFLHQILDAEEGARWDRKLQRRRRWSKLGPPVTLEGFDWAARPQLAPQIVKELLTCRFVEEHRNVILVGRPSTGKTTVAKALGHAACARALSVYYASMAEVLQTLHAARADGTYRKVFRRVTGPDLLILDDAGFSDLARDAANESLSRRLCQASAALNRRGFKSSVQAVGRISPVARAGGRHRRSAGRRCHDPPLHRQTLSPAPRGLRRAARWRVTRRRRPSPHHAASQRDYRPAPSPRGGAGRPVKCHRSARRSRSTSRGNPDVSGILTPSEVDAAFPHRP
jgi:DNA replication protein DnaC